MHFNTQYDRKRPAPLIDTSEPVTQQHFGPQVNINNIMAKALRTGEISTGLYGGRSPRFGDFSQVTSFQDAHNQILQAQEAFMTLPAAVRKRFQNDPGQLLAFLENPQNKIEAQSLGLVAPDPEPKSVPADQNTVSK